MKSEVEENNPEINNELNLLKAPLDCKTEMKTADRQMTPNGPECSMLASRIHSSSLTDDRKSVHKCDVYHLLNSFNYQRTGSYRKSLPINVPPKAKTGEALEDAKQGAVDMCSEVVAEDTAQQRRLSKRTTGISPTDMPPTDEGKGVPVIRRPSVAQFRRKLSRKGSFV